LDELPEFKKNVLDGLRQPLEDGIVTIARASMAVAFPSSFMLVAAMNPYGDASGGNLREEPAFPDAQRYRYYTKISRPLLDRIDLQVEVPKVEFKDIVARLDGEKSVAIRKRVVMARNRQLQRFAGKKIYCNSQMRNRDLKKFCAVDDESRSLLEMAVTKLGFSARGYTRILKVARTIADLDGEPHIRAGHISEAIQYRTMDRYFY